MGKPEAHVEDYLRDRVKELGGFHRKVTYQGRNGSPDDWCFFPGAKLIIVECKSDNGTLRPDQKKEIALLRKNGFSVYVANTRKEIDLIMELV